MTRRPPRTDQHHLWVEIACGCYLVLADRQDGHRSAPSELDWKVGLDCPNHGRQRITGMEGPKALQALFPIGG